MRRRLFILRVLSVEYRKSAQNEILSSNNITCCKLSLIPHVALATLIGASNSRKGKSLQGSGAVKPVTSAQDAVSPARTRSRRGGTLSRFGIVSSSCDCTKIDHEMIRAGRMKNQPSHSAWCIVLLNCESERGAKRRCLQPDSSMIAAGYCSRMLVSEYFIRREEDLGGG